MTDHRHHPSQPGAPTGDVRDMGSWMRYFACIAVLLLGIATLALWAVSTHLQQRQSALARHAQTLASAKSIAKDLANALALGIPLDRLVGMDAYLNERRNVNRLGVLRVLDDQHRVTASSTANAAVPGPIVEVPIEATTRAADGNVVRGIAGYIVAAPLADSGVGMSAMALFAMFVAAASAATFAGEGMAYAWQMGPLLRRRVLARAIDQLAIEDYRAVFQGARARAWDRRAQHVVRQVRQINERYAQVRRLGQSLLQTQVAPARGEALRALQHAAFEDAQFATGDLMRRHVVAVQAEARWFCVMVGTAMGGLARLMYLSAERHHVFAVAVDKIVGGGGLGVAAVPLVFGSAPWADWRTFWHPLWQTAGAIDDPLRALCLYACLFGGLALAGRQPSWPKFIRSRNRPARIGRLTASWPAVWPVSLCCVFVAVLSLNWQASRFDWRMACGFAALGGVALGLLLRACGGAIHVARRTPHFDNAAAPLDDAWLGMCLGLCWFGPVIVDALFLSIAPGWIALLLCTFSLSALVMLLARADAYSPWRHPATLRSAALSAKHNATHSATHSAVHGAVRNVIRTADSGIVLEQLVSVTAQGVRSKRCWLPGFAKVDVHTIGAAAVGCVIAAVALSAHLQMLVVPIRPGSIAPMLLKWAALGGGLVCGAAFVRGRSARLRRLTVPTKRRIAARCAVVGTAIIGVTSTAASGLWPSAGSAFSEDVVIVVSMGAVIVSSGGLWVMLALSGRSPARHMAIIAVTLLIVVIALCAIAACEAAIALSSASWAAPGVALFVSTLVSFSAATYLWWLASVLCAYCLWANRAKASSR